MGHVETYRLQDRATGLWVVWGPQGYLLATDTSEDAMRCFVGAGSRQAAEEQRAWVFREPRLAGRELVAVAVMALAPRWCEPVERGFLPA